MTIPSKRFPVLTACIGAATFVLMCTGCESDPVGHSRTVTKTTSETPSATTTTTETRNKDTKIIR